MINEKLMINDKCKTLNVLAISYELTAISYFITLDYLFST